MKLAIMQPYFFPYLGYMQLVNLVDKFVFYDDVNFIKRGWIARNRIISNTDSYLYLGIKTVFEFSSKSYADSKNLCKAERLISICQKEKASTYINSIGGVELYSKDYFKQFGINLQFLDANKVTYNQFDNPFESNLSIIDVLMFNSIDRVKEYLNFFELK